MHRASILIVLLLLPLFSPAAHAETSKVLFVNSYHQGFRWSDDIEKGLRKALGLSGAAGREEGPGQSELRLRIFRMDTKRHQSEVFKKQAALTAKRLIDDWRPDVVVASDDNAAKYLIAPYFKDAALAFVFCGVNWDASVYGLPFSNCTGMVEVAPIKATIEAIKTYARGPRIGYLGADTATNRKEIAYQKTLLGIHYTDGALVSDFETWKAVYLRLQDSVDMLVWQDPTTIDGWNGRLAEDFVYAHTRIPTGVYSDPVVRYGLLGRVNIAEEQGWWAGKTALRILGGTAPSDIPIVQNRQSRLFLNMKLAHHLGIKFPMALIEQATLIEELQEDNP
mgnify:CR=1 FL=1